MLDIGWSEMLVIAVVVIVVVGPKELPGMLRTFGKTTSKLRVMANDFRKQFDEALKEAELDDLKKVADDVRSLNPKNEIRKALSPMEKAAQDVRDGLNNATKPAAKPQASPEVALADAPARPAEPAKAGAAAIPGESGTAASPKPAVNGATAKPASGPGKAQRRPAAKPIAKKTATPAAAKPAAAPKPAAKPKSAAKPRAAKPANGGDVS
ncbi:Sec-independent protein translocase protein TatB [Mesorhizobium sp. CAU 1741]|uniref:Sec-independent protein translocase protein TatB n=1 Tax=Mesorhizobium sp. CAU 1741 TaxID=3140366 RepID=UPI00325B6F2E